MATASLDVNIHRVSTLSAQQARTLCARRGNASAEINATITDAFPQWTELTLDVEERHDSPRACVNPQPLLQVIDEGLMKATGGELRASALARATQAWDTVDPNAPIFVSQAAWDASANRLSVSALLPTALVEGLGEGIQFEAFAAASHHGGRETDYALRRLAPRGLELEVKPGIGAEPFDFGKDAAPHVLEAVTAGQRTYLLGFDTVHVVDHGMQSARRLLGKKPGPKGAKAVVELDGALWIGSKSGLQRIEGDRVVAHLKKPDGLPGNAVTALVPMGGGTLLIGTASGYALMQPDGSMEAFTEGLADKKVTHAFADATGTLWLAGAGAVTRRNPDGSLDKLKKSQGVPFTQFYALLPGNRLLAHAGDETVVIEAGATHAQPTSMLAAVNGAHAELWVTADSALYVGSESILLRYEHDKLVKGWNFADGARVAGVSPDGDVVLTHRDRGTTRVPANKL